MKSRSEARQRVKNRLYNYHHTDDVEQAHISLARADALCWAFGFDLEEFSEQTRDAAQRVEEGMGR